jgi:hypothetical protein
LSNRAADRYVAAPVVEEYKPKRPATLKLENETFRMCEHEDTTTVVCMGIDDAKKIIRNKVKITSYVKETNAVLDFYERSGTPSSH